MAAPRNPRKRRSSKGRSGSRSLPFLLGFLCACVALSLAGWLYLRPGRSHPALPGPAVPGRPQTVPPPTVAPAHHQLEQPPFGTSEDAFETGARLYAQRCAACHGSPGHNAPHVNSAAALPLQLWDKHPRSGVVGVSGEQPGEIYWTIKNGNPSSGMPAYQHLLTSAQMWDVSLLLKNAGQALPEPVIKLLSTVPDPSGKPAP